ncbi:MAG: tryptophan--tRNA ligase [Gammaproteobacteria bacterium]
MSEKTRLLTGDTPTGRLHLGHWVGSLENRVTLQQEYDSYFLIANIHAFTTRAHQPETIHDSVIDILLDYLAGGIDPQQSTICLQSDIPALAEFTYFLSMLLPFSRVLRNPTIKDEIRDKNLGDHYSFGFLLYAVGQVADILAFRPDIIPVGEDQIPHIEMTREVARRFNQLYCGVDPQAADDDHIAQGGLFPIPTAKLGRGKRLVGTGGPGKHGQLLKMSKSLNNAILLSDDPDTIKKKIMAMYTDPNRLKATDKGSVENNPLWIFHNIFNPDTDWVKAAEDRYRNGDIGDVECKRKLIDVLVELIEPMRQRRHLFEQDMAQSLQILRDGSEKARDITQQTLQLAKKNMQQLF